MSGAPHWRKPRWLDALAIAEELQKYGILCKTTEDGGIVSLDPDFDIGQISQGLRFPIGFYLMQAYDKIRGKSKESGKHPLLCIAHYLKVPGLTGHNKEILALVPMRVLLELVRSERISRSSSSLVHKLK